MKFTAERDVLTEMGFETKAHTFHCAYCPAYFAGSPLDTPIDMLDEHIKTEHKVEPSFPWKTEG